MSTKPMIILDNPVASSHRLERIHMFPGRHLGEEEFDRIQDYADARLAPLLLGAQPGILEGLEINLGHKGVADAGFTVNPGIALAGNGQVLGFYAPLRMEWQELIGDYLQVSGATSAGGVYYLMLRRAEREIDTDAVAPCQRAEFDPTRDSRLEVVGTLFLHRLAVNPNTVDPDHADYQPREFVENWITADRVEATFMNGLENMVPLALLAVRPDEAQGHAVHWLSQESGRYESVPESGYRVLLNQVSAAMRRVMQRAATEVDEATPLPQFLETNLSLNFLPAAGQLPLEWLQNPAGTPPNMLWLPRHLGIDMVAVPEESVTELMNRHIARRVIDLRHQTKDKIRLLLAINEPDYRPDLLDIPQTDATLENDIYRFYMRSYKAWHKWHIQYNELYYLTDDAVLEPTQIKQIDLPVKAEAPITPREVFEKLIEEADETLQDPDNPGTPYPYSKGVPPAPASYTDWLVESNEEMVPPPVPTPKQDGMIIRYAVGLVELEAIENQIRAMRARLEKTRDYLSLQRQQLDSQTVALASLAGGVAGDGTGLQVARWLPFTKMDTQWVTPPAQETVPEASPATDTGSGSGFTMASFMQPMTFSSLLAKDTAKQPIFTLGATTPKKSSAKKIPFSASAYNLNLNKTRLNLLANIPKKALTRPAFEAKEYRFGVMDHISPEINEYAKAYRAMVELFATVDGLFDPKDAKSLKAKLRKVGKLKTPDEVEKEPPVTDHDDTDRTNLIQARYAALFQAGQILTKQIAIVESRFNAIEARLERKLREHSRKRTDLNQLSRDIRLARETLENLDRIRVEQVGDYGVAQRLLDEDWFLVHQTNQGRTRILTTGILGLYYVRVRAAPVSAALADPLELRHGSVTDIVPGCDWTEDVELPEELENFFNAVTEIPMNDWALLRGLRAKIPPVRHFSYLDTLRRTRFQARPFHSRSVSKNGSLQARLMGVHQQTLIMMQHWAKVRLPGFSGSSQRTQRDASRVLSLEDLNAVNAGFLRKPAYELREKLEMCQYCLLEKLNLLQPSLRLQWAQLAEDDRIRVENVAWWPGLEKAEREDFNTTRTVSELIAWWFRQLQPKASRNSRNAMRNMIRATLIYASLGDPMEIIRGVVYVPPSSAMVGELLEVKLNRMPTPGTRLQLLDSRQRVVAMLTVEDHSALSTRVKIVKLIRKNISINTQFNVVANKRTATLG